ncbi:serine/threonine-protein kinase M1 [Mortierella sp. NVP85]|nr:serine/threonine-protein kinase M1 [Mortierella sp. NVP85]
MILDLITPLSLVRQSDHLNALLICLASGPWFPDLARVELWQRSEDAMDLDSVGGLQQLVNGIHAIAEGTEILSRLQDNPHILQSCEKFREQKSKALKIMATFAQCPRLDVWRREAILHTLKDLEHGTDITDFETSDALKIASLDSLTVLSTHCPDMTWTIETALRYLQLDEESEEVKRTLGRCIGMIACGYSSIHLNTDSRYYYDTSSLLYVTRWTCPECDKPAGVASHAAQDKPKSHEKLKLGFLDPFKRLIPNCISPESRLALLQGLSRAFCHLDLANVDLGALDFGKFVLLQLHDSNSAVRTAAGDIVERIAKMAAPTLLDDPLGNSSFDNCLASIYGTITKASSRKNLGAMLSLCRRMMRHLPEDHATYNDVLLAVIDQLFSEHNVNRAGFILDELAAIAREKGFTNYRLLQPHMEIVNALVIGMLSSNQDRWLESFYHWTGHSQMRYFEQNIQDLIPKMILCQHRSLIEKAAMILKEKVGEICINNVDHILAAVYMSRNEELIKPCIELLRDLIFQSESDSGTRAEALGIAELTTLSTESLLCYIIVELGQDDQSKREKARKVIDIIEGYARERTKDGKSKKPSLAAFMMRNILAIMSKVNAAFSDTQKRVTLRTKVKYLRCLVPLVKMLDPIQRSVLSQIFTPLNIALSVRGLRPHALQALDGIIRSVKTSQLDAILSHIVHTLVKQYTHSNHAERSTELEILEFLIFNQELTPVLPDVEDLPDLPEFEAMNRILRSVKSQGTLEQQLQRLIERIGNENSELAEQAVIELRTLLLANNEWLLNMATTREKNAPPVLCDLIKSLFSGISRFRGLDGPVPRRSIECLGIIGAIDPAKLSEMRLIPAPPVYTNFSNLEEAKDFVCRLIEVQLVGKTRSIGDIRSEDRWAITLQSLLSFCGITKEVLGAGAEKSTPSRSAASTQQAKSAEDRWQAFPRHVQEVLELLIDARYAEKTSPQDYPYPIYLHSKTFKEWLTAWTQVLIGRVTSPYAKEVFQACKNVVPYDINSCLYILPHLVLNVLIEGSEKDRKEIVGEMAAILGDALNWKNRKDDGAEQSIGMQKQISSELNQLGSQTVFVLFDHISKWIQITKAASTKSTSSRSYTSVNEPSQAAARVLEMTLSGVQAHLTSISHDVIAMASFRFKGYARSLLHYEQYIRESRSQQGLSEQALQAMYEKHQEIYAHMEEPDGMDGISGLITSGTLNQNLLQCESAGRWSEALAYYELGMQEKPGDFDNYAGLYKCHDNLGQFRTLLSCVEGDIKTHPEWEQQLTDWRIASARKVQDWESMTIALSRSTHPSFEVGLGQLMLDMRDNRVEDFGKHLQQVRCMLIPPLAATSMESYSRSYESMVQLHLLHELEVAFRSWNTSITAGDTLGSQIAIAAQGTDSYVDRVRAYQPILDKRFESMAPSFKVREQVARLRRLAFYDVRIPHIISEEDLTYLKESCGKLWLESAKSARKAGNSQVSYSALLHAEEFMERSSAIERAKWEFLHQNERQAIKTIDSALKRTLASQPGSSLSISSRISSTPVTGRLRQTSTAARRLVILQPELNRTQDRVIDKSKMGFIRAKAHLLRTQWMDRSSLVSPSDIIEGYRQATLECERWEKSYYLAGQYYLKLYDASKRSKHRPPNYSYLTGVCRHYGKALTLGPKYLYQALPRLLTFWLDLGQQAMAGPSPASVEFQHVNDIMMNLAGILPEYMIISRICHKNASAFEVLQHIIVNVVLAFPDQAIWQMVSVSRSVVPERKRVCNMILDTIHLRPTIGQAITERIKEALDLCDNLITLCMAPVPDKVDRLSLQKHFPKVYPQLRQHYNVAIPCQQSLWPSIPGSSATMASHQPFRPNLPKIDRFMDEIEVMSSLQKPRKITVAGSDGVLYTFLCKPKDDLRKDAKVMEFNGLVNMLLRKDRETSKRNLYIRTYSVVPLNEECGIIEWVHNTLPFRHVVYRQYKANNISTPQIIDIKRVLDHEDHVRLFAKELVPKFPPYFYRWFFDISPEPSAWFETRLRYTRTTAVMSMVGHIMGLGDRHGENLLFDERNGDLVHVDFNCLFEQGKSFPKPERVPFRLTHNMIDAMGLSGYDGVYRISCEKTLQVFRDNLESLASVLEGFIHDPLVEWSKSKRKSQQIQQEAIRVAAAGLLDQEGDETVSGAADEARARLRSRAEAKAAAAAAAAAEVADAQQNEKAQAILMLIKRKLSGTENANPYVPAAYALSVRGQVEELIQAATSPENLAKMYIGWSAYL